MRERRDTLRVGHPSVIRPVTSSITAACMDANGTRNWIAREPTGNEAAPDELTMPALGVPPSVVESQGIGPPYVLWQERRIIEIEDGVREGDNCILILLHSILFYGILWT